MRSGYTAGTQRNRSAPPAMEFSYAKLSEMIASTGVYFLREDYAPFWVRLLVDVIDFTVFGVFCAVLAVAIISIFPNGSPRDLLFLTFVVAGNLYFIVLKRSRFRTVGYRVGRVKIVGLDGQLPSYQMLCLRSAFGLLGPLNWLDSIWLFNNRHRQALRDAFTGT